VKPSFGSSTVGTDPELAGGALPAQNTPVKTHPFILVTRTSRPTKFNIAKDTRSSIFSLFIVRYLFVCGVNLRIYESPARFRDIPTKVVTVLGRVLSTSYQRKLQKF
jgi:hypothetical protein